MMPLPPSPYDSRASSGKMALTSLLIISLGTGGCANMSPGEKAAAVGTGLAALRVGIGALRGEDMRYVVPQAMRIGAAGALATYVIAKRHATEYQISVARQRAYYYERRVAYVSPAARVQPKPRSRYIAVDAPRDAQSTGAATVMIWDTEANALVTNEVYDLRDAPAVGRVSRFEEVSAEYVGR
jgi:hypothetical protein